MPYIVFFEAKTVFLGISATEMRCFLIFGFHISQLIERITRFTRIIRIARFIRISRFTRFARWFQITQFNPTDSVRITISLKMHSLLFTVSTHFLKSGHVITDTLITSRIISLKLYSPCEEGTVTICLNLCVSRG